MIRSPNAVSIVERRVMIISAMLKNVNRAESTVYIFWATPVLLFTLSGIAASTVSTCC